MILFMLDDMQGIEMEVWIYDPISGVFTDLQLG